MSGSHAHTQALLNYFTQVLVRNWSFESIFNFLCFEVREQMFRHESGLQCKIRFNKHCVDQGLVDIANVGPQVLNHL
jgi:hypothetical protein